MRTCDFPERAPPVSGVLRLMQLKPVEQMLDTMMTHLASLHDITRHVHILTQVGVVMAIGFLAIYVLKRKIDFAILGVCCLIYAAVPVAEWIRAQV